MKLGDPQATPQGRCTNCGKTVDRATGLDTNTAPSPGDVSICLSCGHIMVFADDGQLRDPTAAECHDIADDPRILKIQWARGKIKPPPI